MCGMIRGAFEMMNVRVKVYFVKDDLRGENASTNDTELRIELIEVMQDRYEDDSD